MANEDEAVRWDGPVPVYQQVAEFLRRRIQREQLRPDDRLPSESDLMGTYAISRKTARAAIQALREKGLVYTVPQRGTFVAPSQHGQDAPGQD